MRRGAGEEYSHGISVQLTRARSEVKRQLNEMDRVRVLWTVRDEVRPLARKLRETTPETFAAHRDAPAVLLDDRASPLFDEVSRPPAADSDAPVARRTDLRGADGLLDAGRPGGRPVVRQLCRAALDAVDDPVPREVIRANQQGVHILQRDDR
ncbi:hypothetical protein [Streptomyces rhizosphaerihabitans]|uniref:hypothetical protein n=1 Tax=Streptomyces rhizosphaerihabitans TaxID=1266770 RepID=UPI0021C08017|nr:hypothetical protein [Streptomyces rhizosphaerihabitans]MCT9009695.1 hypothetical protein [Streptomyces rhizosphaerihabitans]